MDIDVCKLRIWYVNYAWEITFIFGYRMIILGNAMGFQTDNECLFPQGTWTHNPRLYAELAIAWATGIEYLYNTFLEYVYIGSSDKGTVFFKK